MQLFRATTTRSDEELKKSFKPYSTLRLPSHVSYVVDNLWEYLRPETMPCRRHSVYASPTAELALANAAKSAYGKELTAYKVDIRGSSRIAQLKVTDARHHKDVTKIRDLVQKSQAEWVLLPWPQRQCFAMLFVPGCSKADWTRLIEEDPVAKAFSSEASAISEFWQDASSTVDCGDGELFFQMEEHTGSYQLSKITPSED